jgi:hypothetical protein
MGTLKTTPARDPDLELLSQAITASGLTLGRFAREVMIREELTVRRWLSGETDLPAVVRKWLHHGETKGWAPAEMRRVLQDLVDLVDGAQMMDDIVSMKPLVDRARALLG